MIARAITLALALILNACTPSQANDALETLGIRIFRMAGGASDRVSAEGEGRVTFRPSDDALPDGRFALGLHNIAGAWLIDPTERYDHGVLGDAVEAGGLRVQLRDGGELVYRLPSDSVFEGLRPWVIDLDGDGNDEIIAVRSYLDAGAALAVFGVQDDRIVPLSQTDPIGQPYRWLNPAGVGDFDGDGVLEIAYVETPHIGGILHILSFEDGRLRREGSLHGFSNHVMGSRALGLSAVLDLDGDGAEELLLPAADRRKLRLMSFAGGAFRELAAVEHRAAIVTNFQVKDRDGSDRPDVSYGLSDGTLIVLSR